MAKNHKKEFQLANELFNILVKEMPDVEEIKYPWKKGAASAIGNEIPKDYRSQTEMALMDALLVLSKGTINEKICSDIVKTAKEILFALEEKDQ